MHVIVWEFRVHAGCESDFERTYGPQGAWAQLFATGDGYLGTELLRDRDAPGRYLTIDRWTDAAAYARFHDERSTEYATLDAMCEPWTLSETSLGQMDSVPDSVVSGPRVVRHPGE